MVRFIIRLYRFILSKYISRHSYIYRPTEIQAFANIEREQKIIRNYGIKPHFTDFELKVYALDYYVRKHVIPKAIADNKVLDRSARVPIPVYWVAERTSHTPDYIQRILNTIDDKIYLRDKLKIYPVYPKLDKVKI